MDVRISTYSLNGEVYTIGMLQDITTRKQTEHRLNVSLHELQQLKNKLREENRYLQEEINTDHDFHDIIGRDPSIKQVLDQIRLVAPTNSTVLIQGETGTGKELVARAVHRLSKRNNHPLLKVDCSSLPLSLMESELFGHEKGAFTGATSRRIGRFELAATGTIFLDEIGELPVELQIKLLRILQDGEFERLGSSHTIQADFRIIAATNRSLEQLIKENRFRSDLYYGLLCLLLCDICRIMRLNGAIRYKKRSCICILTPGRIISPVFDGINGPSFVRCKSSTFLNIGDV